MLDLVDFPFVAFGEGFPLACYPALPIILIADVHD